MGAIGKHTPGPWHLLQMRNKQIAVEAENGHAIAGMSMCTSAQVDADARLIAAAPKMYEVLKAMVEMVEDSLPKTDDWTPTLNARVLLREIEGD